MESGYLILDHPADLGIEAHGKTLPEAFEQAACGLTSVILDRDSIRLVESRPVRIEAGDRQQLLVRWLSEVLYLYDGLNFAPRDFKVQMLSSRLLEARVRGEPFDRRRHTVRLDVKAITYHQLKIRRRGPGHWLQVFLDI